MRWTLRTAVLAAALTCVHATSASERGEDYDQLVRKARAGDTAPALEFLRQQSASSARSVADWIDIAGWAELDSEVVSVYETRAQGHALAASTMASVARAYRNLRRWDDALAVYHQARQRAPGDVDLRIGEIQVLADAGRDADALRQGLALVEEAPMVAERRLALAYVHRSAERYFAALAEVSRARSLAPGRGDTERAYADALQSAGLPTRAQALVDPQPDLLPPAQRRRLQGDIAAELVRLAFEPTTTEGERYRSADRALAMYDQLLQEWSALPGGAPEQDLQRIRVDRLGALTARSRMDEAIAAFEALRSEGIAVPDYALRWIAGAFLYNRQPERAAQLYGGVLERGSPHPESRKGDATGLFYSWVEAEQMERAVALSQATADSLSPRLPVRGLIGGIPSDAWADAQREAAQARGFADDTPEAQLRLEHMLSLAPGNHSIRTALAGVYRARAWPRRAEEELKLAETMDPRSLGLELQQGFTALDLQEWRQADALADDVIERFPENRQAQRLDRLRSVHRKAELRLSGYRGLSSNSPVSGNGDYGIDTAVYTPPLEEDWRLFGGTGFRSGKFQEGRGLHRALRVGLEHRSRDLHAEAEVSSHHFGYGQRIGLRLEGWRDVGDHWQFGGAIEKLSRDTPLRALASNVTADSATAFVRWRAHERREWRVSLQPMRYSDGNKRFAAFVLGRERVYTAPYLAADLALEIAASRNTRQDVPYFSPAADLTLMPRLDISHVLYRHYQTEWRHQLQVGAGAYAQRGYSSGSIAMIGYSHRVRFNDVVEAAAGVSVTRRPYDGVNERIVRGTFDLLMRF